MKASLFALTVAVAIPIAAPAWAQQQPAQQAEPANRFAATIAPAERFEVQGMLVERHGQGGRPLILIPGLGGGSWVWQETVRDFAGGRAVYVVTLPGFDGRPAPAGDPIEGARRALLELIATRKLDKPVLVGHSIGGTLALALAEMQPARIGGVVSIDGLPVFPGTEDVPADQRLRVAEGMGARMAAVSGPAFAEQQKRYMRSIGVVDMNKADELARLGARSDPQAMAAYVSGIVALDLRPNLAAIAAPVLVLAPYFALDAMQTGVAADQKLAYYRALMKGTPRVEVIAVDNARHFAMFDQPRAVSDALRAFLKNL
ncbi:alpha/beta fold hydrolase [Massilia haematophila]|uniref:Alpha/beta fold hydrolase n=1 Tax=Massilia haematophila TaxID=457923 RepID=A0ABV7PGR0_9BURK